MATEATKIPFVEAAAPATPAASRVVVYAKADGLIYSKDDAGVETLMSGGIGGGSVATDAIFDAKGDLAAGTGANTAAKLTVGANDTILMADSGQSTGLKWVAAGTPTDQDYDDVAAVGTSDTFARGDHLHGMPSAGGGGGVSACLATRTTSQSIGADPTAIAFNAADIYDPDGWHDPSSNNTRLICPTGKGGKLFMCSWSVELDITTGATPYARLLKNGSTVAGQNVMSFGFTHTGSCPVFLNDTDYVELLITNRTSGNVIVTDAPCTFGIMG